MVVAIISFEAVEVPGFRMINLSIPCVKPRAARLALLRSWRICVQSPLVRM
jgi:hypothetical protein